ncbi:helix-turn-helix domain-containing protein [Saccharopolyspora phatthalungensis]|uniref:Transcriptional regulator with XRE-family HTH domain n=1 Tax=Saccharopolyspora phatthalungensis TaxID=664693 RepID=A0A840QDV1_9PSEU|nr:helix-turn-helix transcriptional regulator [Saccharopolyspora phatthalungensis]MBB5158964.1 transcriptional regulator with XRE-family HTH domain [Saccharopolyspora phatthalungensis]
MGLDDAYIGRRVREIRTWRRMNLAATAELAGISPAYLSMIERGLRAVTRRPLLDGLAQALRVSPEDLTGQPYRPADPLSAEAQAGIAAVEAALDAYDLGTDPSIEARPWPEISADIQRLNDVLRADADYASLGTVIPGLLAELHAAYVHDSVRRREALIGLIYTYRSAAGFTKCLGVRGLPLVAARLAQQCAEELDSPEWIGFAAFIRGYSGGALDRPHQYTHAVRTIDRVQGSLDDPNVVQAAGALHLNAALVCASQRDPERAHDHVSEAENLATRLPDVRQNFGWLYFAPENVGVWQVSLGTELGEGGRVAEYARTVQPRMIEGKARRAAFLADVGRALASERKTRAEGIETLAEAERTAPQLIRNNPLVRETVTDLLAAARREAGGRELRGLAFRMGVAPTG